MLFLPALGSAQGTLSPSPYQVVLDNAGKPISGACVWTFVSGTTTPAPTFTDSDLATPNSNPILTSSAGRYTAFLSAGSSYKFVIEQPCVAPAHGAVIATADHMTAVPASSAGVDVVGTAGEALSAGRAVYLSDGSGSKNAGQWYHADSANAYSATGLTVGMVQAAIAAGASGTIRVAGSVTGLSALTPGAIYYVGSAGNVTTTAPTLARFLGPADTTASLVLAANPGPKLTRSTLTITTTGNLDDYDFKGVDELRLNNASLTTVRGLVAGVSGQRVRIVSVGAGQVDLAHQNAGSISANRLQNVATSAATSLAPGVGVADYEYDTTAGYWRLVQHEQGAWIAGSTGTCAPNCTAFAANNSMTFAVTAGQVSVYRYRLIGRTVQVSFDLGLSTVGGTPSTALLVTIPGGFTAASTYRMPMAIIDNNVAGMGVATVAGSATTINCFRDRGLVTNWTASANTMLTGVVTLEVQ